MRDVASPRLAWHRFASHRGASKPTPLPHHPRPKSQPGARLTLFNIIITIYIYIYIVYNDALYTITVYTAAPAHVTAPCPAMPCGDPALHYMIYIYMYIYIYIYI